MIKFEIFHEQLGPITLMKHEWQEYLRRRQANIRPHCSKCGRFLKKENVKVYHHWEYYNEIDYLGHCETCGDVGVTWPEW